MRRKYVDLYILNSTYQVQKYEWIQLSRMKKN